MLNVLILCIVILEVLLVDLRIHERKLEILPTIINNLVLFIYVLTIDPITLPVLVLQLPLTSIIV